MRRLIHTWPRPDSEGSVHLTRMAALPKWGKKAASREKAEFNLAARSRVSVFSGLESRRDVNVSGFFHLLEGAGAAGGRG